MWGKKNSSFVIRSKYLNLGPILSKFKRISKYSDRNKMISTLHNLTVALCWFYTVKIKFLSENMPLYLLKNTGLRSCKICIYYLNSPLSCCISCYILSVLRDPKSSGKRVTSLCYSSPYWPWRWDRNTPADRQFS